MKVGTKTRKKRIDNLEPKNCAPIIRLKNKSVNSWSCFTPEILIQLRDEYNKRYPDKIISNKPKTIWKSLQKKMKKCKSEMCWLNRLASSNAQVRLKEILFSPEKPKSWNKDPNTWLTNFDIENVLNQYEESHENFDFIGPSFIDFNSQIGNSCVDPEICNFNLEKFIKKGKNKIGIVFNLDKHNQSGSHWVSLFIDVKNKFIFYFDSNGTDIPPEIKHLVDKIVDQGKKINIDFKVHINSKEHQYSNTECGMYSLYFIITLLTEMIADQSKTIPQLLHFFKKQRISDKDVEQFRNIYYN